FLLFFFASRRLHTISKRDWSSDVCSSDLTPITARKYIASNLVVNTIILGVQVLIMLCALSFIFDIDMGMPFWQVVVVLWLFSLVAVGVSLVIVAYSNTRSVASGLSNLVILPTIMI